MAWTSEEFQHMGDHARETIGQRGGSPGAAVCMLSDVVAQVGAVLAEMLSEMRRPRHYTTKMGNIVGSEAPFQGAIIDLDDLSIVTLPFVESDETFSFQFTLKEGWSLSVNFHSEGDCSAERERLVAAWMGTP